MKRLVLASLVVIIAVVGLLVGLGHLNKKSTAPTESAPAASDSASAEPSQAQGVPFSELQVQKQEQEQQQDVDSTAVAAQVASDYVKIYLNAPGAAYPVPTGWLEAARPLMTDDYYQRLVNAGEYPFSDDTYSAMHERSLNVTAPDISCQPIIDDSVLNSQNISVQCDYTTVTVGADGKPYDTSVIPTVWPYDTGLNETFVAQMQLVEGKWLVTDEVPLSQ